jgi:hypothetical protein
VIDLWQLASDLDLEVVERRGIHRSGYAPGDRHVELRPRMRGRVLRSVLGHEIGHHVLGHRPTDFGPIRKRQEHQANRWAALQLIEPAAYAEAEQLRGGHVPSMAFDLNVSDELVLVYQQTLLRTDRATYVRPRLGVGQWAHRIEVA